MSAKPTPGPWVRVTLFGSTIKTWVNLAHVAQIIFYDKSTCLTFAHPYFAGENGTPQDHYLNIVETPEQIFGQAAAPELLEACRAMVEEYQNLEDRIPLDPYCGDCNLGTGPHKRFCAYHTARAAIAKAGAAP